MIFRKRERPLEEEMGGMIVTKFLWLWCLVLESSSLLRVNLPWRMKLPARGLMTIEFLLEDLSLGR